MRKGRDGGKKTGKTGEKKNGKKEKRLMEIVATTSLPAVDRPNADRWNAARSRQKEKRKKRMAFLVATTSLPAVYRPNGYARTTTAGTPHARAKIFQNNKRNLSNTEISQLQRTHYKSPCNWIKSSVSSMTSAEEGQPPSNEPEE